MLIVSKLRCNGKHFGKNFKQPLYYPFPFLDTANYRHYSADFNPTQCKAAVFTGGITGCTLNIAETFLDRGGRAVVIGGSDSNEIRNYTKQLNKKYGATEKVIFQPSDLTSTCEVESLFKFAKEKFQNISFVVNGAEVDKTIDETVYINIQSVILGTLFGLKYMNKKSGGRGGCIVNISSVLAIEPFFGCPIFSGTKAFIVGFSRSIGSEYFFNKTGVKVVTFCPNISNTIVNNKNRCLPGFKKMDQACINSELQQMHVSHPEEFQEIFDIINDTENGSVWIADGCKFFKACFDKWGGRKSPKDSCPNGVCDPPKKIGADKCLEESKKVIDPRGPLCCSPCEHEGTHLYPKPDMCKLKSIEKEVLKIAEQTDKATAHCPKPDTRGKESCVPCKKESPRVYTIDLCKLQEITEELKKIEANTKKQDSCEKTKPCSKNKM